MTMMPQDLDARTIPVLGYRHGDGAHQITIGAASARNTTAFNTNTRAISIFATADCFIE